MLLQDLLEMSSQDAFICRNFLNKIFNRLGNFDVNLGVHFRDRLLDRENEVTLQDLMLTFSKFVKKYQKTILEEPKKHLFIATIKDNETQLNIPFQVLFDERKNKYYMKTITIMRKDPSTFGVDNFGGIELYV